MLLIKSLGTSFALSRSTHPVVSLMALSRVSGRSSSTSLLSHEDRPNSMAPFTLHCAYLCCEIKNILLKYYGRDGEATYHAEVTHILLTLQLIRPSLKALYQYIAAKNRNIDV